MSAGVPPSRASRLRAFWSRRSRKGKAALIAGAVVLVFTVIGYAAPSEPEIPAADGPPAAEAAEEQPTTETAETTTEAGAETTTEATPAPRPLLVARVIDGDTLDLDNGDRIRLVQIDAPEAKGECYGKKAGKVLRELLPVGTEVRVVRDHRLDDVDRYGRLLRYVFRDNKNVNLVLVQQGAASVWFFDGDRGRYAGKLLSAAERAQAEERGAWGACDAELDPSRSFETRPKERQPATTTTDEQPDCEPGYTPCLPVTDDLDCPDVRALGLAPVSVSGSDRYRLDADGDGSGCE